MNEPLDFIEYPAFFELIPEDKSGLRIVQMKGPLKAEMVVVERTTFIVKRETLEFTGAENSPWWIKQVHIWLSDYEKSTYARWKATIESLSANNQKLL